MYDLHHTTMSALPFEKKEKQAIIFIGIQACGKTTFYHRMLSDGNYVHISLDELHTRNKESQELTKCLENGNSFVIDNTNPGFLTELPIYKRLRNMAITLLAYSFRVE